MKNLSQTRLSCREDAIQTLVVRCYYVLEAFTKTVDDSKEKVVVKLEAKFWVKKMKTFEISFIAIFRHKVLHRFDWVRKVLQKPGLDVVSEENSSFFITFIHDIGNIVEEETKK